MNGNLQKISNYIFIATPDSVELSGDFQDILAQAVPWAWMSQDSISICN